MAGLFLLKKRTVKRTPRKRDIRRNLEHDIERFMASGGQIDEVQSGSSGLPQDGSSPLSLFRAASDGDPKKERTPLNEVVAAIDARKAARKKPQSKRSKGPKKVWVYDDFGEPVRWYWDDSK